MKDPRICASAFGFKTRYILDRMKKNGIRKGRMRIMADILHEKESTINNWLFAGKIPRENKKLGIADALGVSLRYLFDDSIDVNDMSKPEVEIISNIYWVPVISCNDLPCFLEKEFYSVTNREKIFFPGMPKLIDRFGPHICLMFLDDDPGTEGAARSGILYSSTEFFKKVSVTHDDEGLGQRISKNDPVHVSDASFESSTGTVSIRLSTGINFELPIILSFSNENEEKNYL